MTTLDDGSTTCVCEKGSYMKNGKCISCPDDVNCDKDGSTLATVNLKPGAWRPNAESEEIFECPIKNSCLGGISIDTYVGDAELLIKCTVLVTHCTLND